MTSAAPKYKPCEMVLTCILTDDERRARGIEIGACVEKLEESEDEFKAVKSRFDREKKELTGKIRDLSRATRTGEEMRTVNCQKVYDYANGRVYWIREDLGEVFKERPMHEDEKQFELFKPETEEQQEVERCFVCLEASHPGKKCAEVALERIKEREAEDQAAESAENIDKFFNQSEHAREIGAAAISDIGNQSLKLAEDTLQGLAEEQEHAKKWLEAEASMEIEDDDRALIQEPDTDFSEPLEVAEALQKRIHANPSRKTKTKIKTVRNPLPEVSQ